MSDGGLDIYFSDIFDVAPETLEAYGALDVSLINDLPLFIDPFLLFNSTDPVHQALHETIIRYLRFLRDKATTSTMHRGLLEAWFTFREVKQNWLGFSVVGNSGRGLGSDFATALNLNLHSVFKDFGEERVTKGSHLEKLCLIKDGVGRDNISDFTTTLIKEHLLTYTQAFAQAHLVPATRRIFGIEKVRFNYATESWEAGRFELPVFNGDFVLLTPKSLLTRTETWINRPELLHRVLDIAEALPNEALRAQVNSYFHAQLSKKPTAKETHAARVRTIEAFPAIIEHYIREKEDTGAQATAVSEERVRQAEALYLDDVRGLRAQLAASTPFYLVQPNTYEETHQRIAFLKDVIENKDGYRIFYRGREPLTREEDIQILYRLTWFGSASDVNREVNNGRGPVDFKVSRGATDRTLVEFKLASNTKLKRNLERQVEIYQKASDAPRALKVITYFAAEQEARVLKVLEELSLLDNPDIILIDAQSDNKPSGSKA